MADDNSTVPSQRKGRCRGRKTSISSLPDVILQHILCFIPTKFAIRTSVLSKRWRHVWCDTPSLSFDRTLEPASIDETLNRYTALKVMSFHLFADVYGTGSYVDKWIEFAMSRNVENLSLGIWLNHGVEFEFPDFFYNNSSVKQLTLIYIIPTCSVSWTSLKKLSLTWCKLPDESIAKILSGCPILESLTLGSCKELRFLDLSKYPCLRTLQVEYNAGAPGPTQIVAPHIHCLTLMNYLTPCTLVDVSSLTEAKLDIYFSCINPNFNAYFLRVMMLKMLEKLQNVEKLTLGESFLQILSLAEIRGVPFPMFKIKSMTLQTSISQYVIPGIERMLQKLT